MQPIYTRMYSALKTFLNIAEAQFKKWLNYDVCVVYNDVQKDKKTAGNTNSFEVYAVTIKISMTEYHHLINSLAHGLF